MNAIGSHTCRALAAAVGRVENNGRTRAVVVHGAGRAFSAGAEALSLGLVDRVFDRDVLMAETLTYARDLARFSSPLPMGVMKQQVYEAQESNQEEARTMAIRWWYDVLREHGDFKEGIGSYLEKREPSFAPWDPATPHEPAPLPAD